MQENAVRKAAQAKEAGLKMSFSSGASRNAALKKIISGLKRNKSRILAANLVDVRNASKSGVAPALLKRLELSDSKFSEIVHEVEGVLRQPEMVGRRISAMELDKGLLLEQVSAPIGVICAIFEARPDAFVQISCLSVKTGNAALLKGGSEALRTNRELAKTIRSAVKGAKLPQNAIQLVESRSAVRRLISLSQYIDLIIPRGSKALVNFIRQNSTIPVLGHAEGVCHEYVDAKADLKKAAEVCFDAKCQYPAVCNAMETLLVHKNAAAKFLPLMAARFGGAVELRCDPQSRRILSKAGFRVKKASAKDWAAEYNDLILSIKVVGSVSEAIRHINSFGSKHTDGIITEDTAAAKKFLAEVDSASVMWNASTRFADGFRYGKGAEVGISTGKIHARGPSGAEALLSYKYIVKGSGHKVADYSGKGSRKFLHRKIK